MIGGTSHDQIQYHEETPQESTHQTPTVRDERPLTIENYLRSYGSPYSFLAEDIVSISDTYGVDPFLLVAIFIKESSGGKACYQNNCFGWGIYGDNRVSFNTVLDGFSVVARNFKESPLYAGKTDRERLLTYNPDPSYSTRVLVLTEQIRDLSADRQEGGSNEE